MKCYLPRYNVKVKCVFYSADLLAEDKLNDFLMAYGGMQQNLPISNKIDMIIHTIV